MAETKPVSTMIEKPPTTTDDDRKLATEYTEFFAVAPPDATILIPLRKAEPPLELLVSGEIRYLGADTGEKVAAEPVVKG